MNPKPTNIITSGPLTPVAAILLLGLSAFLIVTSLHLRSTTGTLTIIAPANTAAISISQIDKQVALVGTGTANVRLTPGSYEIVAANNGTHVTGQATVELGKHTTIKLPSHQKPLVPSPDYIDFTGMDTVIANGITTDQAANVRELFFQYKQDAKYIAIYPSSVTPGARDPNSDAPFTLNFTGSIDSVAYKATLTYADLNSVELTLFNPQTGAVLFDKTST